MTVKEILESLPDADFTHKVAYTLISVTTGDVTSPVYRDDVTYRDIESFLWDLFPEGEVLPDRTFTLEYFPPEGNSDFYYEFLYQYGDFKIVGTVQVEDFCNRRKHTLSSLINEAEQNYLEYKDKGFPYLEGKYLGKLYALEDAKALL